MFERRCEACKDRNTTYRTHQYVILHLKDPTKDLKVARALITWKLLWVQNTTAQMLTGVNRFIIRPLFYRSYKDFQ